MTFNIIKIEEAADLASRMLADIDPNTKQFHFSTAVLYGEEAIDLFLYFAKLDAINVEYVSFDSMNSGLYYVSIDSDNSVVIEPATGEDGSYRETVATSVYLDVNAPAKILPSLHSDTITEIDFFCQN